MLAPPFFANIDRLYIAANIHTTNIHTAYKFCRANILSELVGLRKANTPKEESEIVVRSEYIELSIVPIGTCCTALSSSKGLASLKLYAITNAKPSVGLQVLGLLHKLPYEVRVMATRFCEQYPTIPNAG